MQTTKRIFARFSGEQILLDDGRIIFSILHPFFLQGYEIGVFDEFHKPELGKYTHEALDFKHVTRVREFPKDPENYIFLHDGRELWQRSRKWKKSVRIRFDLFSKMRGQNPVLLPFPLHPVHCGRGMVSKVADLRDRPRVMRVFFSGDWNGYRRRWIQFPTPKLSRLEIIDHLQCMQADKLQSIEDSSTLDDIRTGDRKINRCVLVDTQKTWVDDHNWLQLLAGVDFFIAPPGIVMPMSHNITEAMAVGAIPITSYPEWLSPSLTDGENCLTFDTVDDLDRQFEKALEMSDDEIARMRRNVIAYYEDHLNPDRFVDCIERSPDNKLTMLAYCEGNVVRNHAKLDKDSVLLRD